MKLNPKCIKDILSVFEEIVNDAGITYTLSWDKLQEHALLTNYSVTELAYHCQQIYLSGYLYEGQILLQGGISFVDIMPEAHTLLANLRIPAALKVVEKFINIAGSASITQMASIATDASVSMIPELISAVKDAVPKLQK